MASFNLTSGADSFVGTNADADTFSGSVDSLTPDDTIVGGNLPGDPSADDFLRLTSSGTLDQYAFNHVQQIEVINLNKGGNAITLSDAMAETAQGHTLTVHGHAGSDVVDGHFVTSATLDIIGGQGGDELIGGGSRSNISGGDGNDTVIGGNGSDNLAGGNGDDHIFGGLGDETIHANLGNDLIYGGEGLDRIAGNYGSDTIYGGSGDDHISGEEGSDSIYGGTGNDQLSGSAGADTIDGARGNDVISGGDGGGADSLDGGDGADTITGGNGNDTLNGDDGADQLQGDKGADQLNLGSDGAVDHAVFAAVTDGAAAGHTNGADVISGFETANDLIGFTGDFNTGGVQDLNDITADDTFTFADGVAANFDTTDEAARQVFASDTDITNLTTVAAAFNTAGVTASAGADALLVATGAEHTAVYLYVEDGTTPNQVDTTELALLGVADGALTTANFDFLT